MEGIYTVRLGDRDCGEVQVMRQGLYYRFVCKCRVCSLGIFRLQVQSGSDQTDLGVLVPVGDLFMLEKRLPVKSFGREAPRFWLCAKKEGEGKKFVPIYPQEPFSYISRLKEAYLVRQNGRAGIMV